MLFISITYTYCLLRPRSLFAPAILLFPLTNSNQVTSLLKHERIQTTIAKAMALRRIADSMITLGKEGTEASYRRAEGFIREPRVAEKVFKELAVRYKYVHLSLFSSSPRLWLLFIYSP